MLYQAFRDQLFAAVDRVQPASKYKILVVDDWVRAQIALVMPDHAILDRHVANIALIQDRRNVEAYLEAIYIVRQSKFAYDCIQADFGSSSPRYKAAHVYVVPAFNGSESEFEGFKQSKTMQSYLKTCELLPMNLLVLSNSLFSLGSLDANCLLYNPSCSKLALSKAENVAQNIASLCQTLEINPYLRFTARWKITRSNAYPALIAKQAAQMIEQKCSKYSKQPTLLVLDRSVDLTAPLRHEFEFQALALDVLEDKFSPIRTLQEYKNQDVTGKLSVEDEVWNQLRSKHVVEATEMLNARIAELKRQNPHLADSSKQANVRDVRQMLANLPQFMTTRENVTLSLDVALECMAEIERQHLKPVAEFEQNAILGPMHNRFSAFAPQQPLLDTEGALAERLVQLLAAKEIPKPVKIRLLAIYYVHREGLCAEDVERLVKHCRLQPTEVNVIHGLSYLGSPRVISLPRAESGADVPPNPLTTERETQPLLFARLNGGVHNVCAQFAQGRLSSEEYPYAGKCPSSEQESLSSAKSMRNPRQRATWAQTVTTNQVETKAKPSSNNGPLVIYMVGGVTPAESIAVEQISEQTGVPIVIGGDDLLTPSKFLKFLGDMSKPREELDLEIDAKEQTVPKHLLERPGQSERKPVNGKTQKHAKQAQNFATAPTSAPKAQKKSSVPSSNPVRGNVYANQTPLNGTPGVYQPPAVQSTNLPPSKGMHELKLDKEQSTIKHKLKGAFKLKK